jgi:hypothetical protein
VELFDHMLDSMHKTKRMQYRHVVTSSASATGTVRSTGSTSCNTTPSCHPKHGGLVPVVAIPSSDRLNPHQSSNLRASQRRPRSFVASSSSSSSCSWLHVQQLQQLQQRLLYRFQWCRRRFQKNHNSKSNNNNAHKHYKHYNPYCTYTKTGSVARLLLPILTIVVGTSICLLITHTLGVRIPTPHFKYRYLYWYLYPSHQYMLQESSLQQESHVNISKEIQVSVIIMNHARPHYLQQSQLLMTLITHPNVRTIYILHSNPHTVFNNTHLQHLVHGKLGVFTSSSVGGSSGSTNRTVTTQLAHLSTTHLLDKIRHVDAIQMNQQMGLAIRFHYCALLCGNETAASTTTPTTPTPWVLHIDDDMEFNSHSVIDTLLFHMQHNPHRIVGHYGRAYHYYTAPFRHGYDTRTIYGNVEVVLTKILIMEQTLCSKFFDYAPIIADLLQIDPVDSDITKGLRRTNINMSKNANKSSTTTTATTVTTATTGIMVKWNGEDIFMNLVANHYYHVPYNGPYNNYAIRNLPVGEYVDDTTPQRSIRTFSTGINTIEQKEDAISGNMDRNRIWNVGWTRWYTAYQKAQAHTKFRGLLWDITKQRLSKLSW